MWKFASCFQDGDVYKFVTGFGKPFFIVNFLKNEKIF